jgi:hypothetical protein
LPPRNLQVLAEVVVVAEGAVEEEAAVGKGEGE